MGSFTGRMLGNEFVFEGKDRDGDMAHWVYYDLHADHFQWRAELSPDGGRTWKAMCTELEGKHHISHKCHPSLGVPFFRPPQFWALPRLG
jgi:hypothetical protein